MEIPQSLTIGTYLYDRGEPAYASIASRFAKMKVQGLGTRIYNLLISNQTHYLMRNGGVHSICAPTGKNKSLPVMV